MKKFFNNLKQKALAAKTSVTTLVQDVKGDLATNTIGAIIVAVVIIGILVLAVNSFFPSFFADMFNSMKDKLKGNMYEDDFTGDS